MIIDTQTHVIERSLTNINSLIWPHTWHDCTGDWLVAEMDRAGVDKAILISYENSDVKCDQYRGTELIAWDDWDVSLPENGGCLMRKEFTVEAAKKYPDRYIWFTTVNTLKADYWEILLEDIRNGAKGVKLFPAYYGTFPDDPKLMRVYEYCDKNHLQVICANEQWYWENYPIMGPKGEFTTERYMELLKHMKNAVISFPSVKFLFTHWGISSCWFRSHGNRTYDYEGLKPFLDFVNKYENVYTDIAAITIIYDDAGEIYPWPGALTLLKYLAEGVGAHKVMFGTDWPYTEAGAKYFQVVSLVKDAATFLTAEEKKLILGENAAEFLGLK